ncbi:MAG: two-component sensor histidine kinase [Lachnospiraceae bacterium]|nr:two-component sensor histidine kinase [Lachnospiraceae bacterium]
MEFAIFILFLFFAYGMHMIYSYYIFYNYNKKSVEQLVSQVISQCNILADQVLVNQFAISNSQDNLSIEIDQMANVMDGRILVIDSGYRVVKDTYTIEQDKYIISPTVFGVISGGSGMQRQITDNALEITLPILNAEKVVCGAIVMTVSMQQIQDTNAYINQQGNTLNAIFLVLSVLIAYMLSRFISKNMTTLNHKLTYMCNGHLDEPLQVKGFREVEQMSDSIDRLITKLQVLEDSRQEFVSNVSHELKTPITSMKVLADSLLLQEGVPAQTYREFLVDIVEEIDRENEIINDLLTLVKTDKKSASLDVEAVNMNALLELLLKRLRPLAAKRNIEVEYESVRDVVAEIDEVKLSLAFSNLIENAIKYNRDNGWVKVSLNADHKFFYVKVQDSGVGIPEDCQEQIFERFYRVDKARTRQTGGTGLGLAITRNAILLHKGAIKVYSEPGEGTTFTVRIPLNYIA